LCWELKDDAAGREELLVKPKSWSAMNDEQRGWFSGGPVEAAMGGGVPIPFDSAAAADGDEDNPNQTVCSKWPSKNQGGSWAVPTSKQVRLKDIYKYTNVHLLLSIHS
jgi:hypothetical protein